MVSARAKAAAAAVANPLVFSAAAAQPSGLVEEVQHAARQGCCTLVWVAWRYLSLNVLVETLTDRDIYGDTTALSGIYNLIEPYVSDAVLAPKLRHIAATGATVVVTGNPGCLMQISAGLLRSGSPVRVVHPIDLLDAAYAAEFGGRG